MTKGQSSAMFHFLGQTRWSLSVNMRARDMGVGKTYVMALRAKTTECASRRKEPRKRREEREDDDVTSHKPSG